MSSLQCSMDNLKPHLLTLPDGRNLAYAIYGVPLETEGTVPTFFFHGYPGTHHEAQLLHESAKRRCVSLIAPTRPGMGHSTSQPKRQLLDWPSDVMSLADHLDIARFAAIGVSGGGPYVLACWQAIPRARLVAATIVCGLYPSHLGLKGMMFGPRMLLTVAPWAPWLVAAGLSRGMKSAAVDHEHPEKFEKLMDEDMNGRPEVDRAVYAANEGGFRTIMVESTREAVAGGGQGPAWEAKLYGSDWGFFIEELEADGRLLMWHGDLDVNVPIAMAEKASRLIRGAILRPVTGEGHCGLIVHKADEIIESLRKLCVT
ncbi:putative alpha beta hydrolase protein [Zalerion maritima]|uniref:Alpha beta hydrolase protein n=1 Tax=Zalerion maritima TaxID=339359 RepID=A0AAD5WP03_9PEZI|nr:putative alpha beta hydrolase protein [Zalerion maritima]